MSDSDRRNGASGGDRVRRDPRAEREARTAARRTVAHIEPDERADEGESAAHGTRVRRDPRAERTRARQRAPAAESAPATPAAPSAPAAPVRVIEDPACYVLAVPDLEDGRLSIHDCDTFGAARLLVDGLGGAVAALLCIAPGDVRDDLDLGGAGADRVVALVGVDFEGYAPEARAAAVLAVAESLEARHILFPDTATDGGDLGRRIATKLGARAATNVQRLATESVVCRGRGGKSDFVMPPPRVLLIAAEAADPVAGERFEARPIEPVPFAVITRVTDRGLAAIDPNAVPLVEADFIVSGGNGVTDWDNFHRVAAALGATEGGSRVVCDAGQLPRDRQVGASGTLVEPRAYLAFGIAGASQHLQGITKCERVVAVNTDLYADMVKRADLAVIADAQQVMPALAELAERKRHGS